MCRWKGTKEVELNGKIGLFSFLVAGVLYLLSAIYEPLRLIPPVLLLVTGVTVIIWLFKVIFKPKR